MKKLFILFLTFCLLISLVNATEIITENTFIVTDFLSEDVSEPIKYNITPDADSIVIISLTGSSGYAPRIDLYDILVDYNVPLYRVIADRGKTATVTFTTHSSKEKPITYTIVLVTREGLTGAEYTFNYELIHQNDAESGTDAPETYKEAFPLQTGTYEGFLGGADETDFYSLDLKAGETVDFALTAHEEGMLGIIVTDEDYSKKIDVGRYLDLEIDDATLYSSFTSLRDQIVKVNINGGVPYTLVYTSDREEGATGVVLEPIEETLPPTPPVPEPLIVPVPVPVPEPTQEEKKSDMVFFIVIIVLGAALLTTLLIMHFHKKKKN